MVKRRVKITIHGWFGVDPKLNVQDGLTGSAWGDWANYTDSPLRAFEGTLAE